MSLSVSPGEFWGVLLEERGYTVGKIKRQTPQAVKDAKRPGKLARTAERKALRRAAQEIQRQANVVRRHMGTATPWEAARALRAAGRRRSNYTLAS